MPSASYLDTRLVLSGPSFVIWTHSTASKESVKPRQSWTLRTPYYEWLCFAKGGHGGGVVLSFAAHKVKVPECGDFSAKMSQNWTNIREPNFGCAFQRYLDLMVRDPGDLQKAQPLSGGDGTKAAKTIDSYRTPAGSD
jgi:hypothetical protein